MIKNISQFIEKVGMKSVIGGILIISGFIIISDIESFKSIFELKSYGSKSIIAIVFIIIGFVIVYAELFNQKKQLDLKENSNELTEKDKEVLQDIAGLFERKAYMDAELHDEDLRAMFSAANETRINIQKMKNKISFPIIRRLLESMYKDFEEIRKAAPPFETSEIEAFDPDAVNIRPNKERAWEDTQYINNVWSKTSDWEKYKNRYGSIANSGYYPYTAIMMHVKNKLKTLSYMKELIMRVI